MYRLGRRTAANDSAVPESMKEVSVCKMEMKSNGDGAVKFNIGQDVKKGSERSSRLDNDEVDGGDEESSDQAGLQRTPRSSGDDEDVVAMEEDAPGPSSFYGTDHAAFHLPTNLEIREGVDYQCPVQDWTTEDDYYDDTERETCLWRPTNLLEAAEINDYLSIALSSFNIEQDRAMFILQSSDYNLEEAKHQLAKRRIKKEPWSEEDITIFKQALQTCGKHFNKIKQLLPHKSIKEIINFYYDNKKKLNFRSIIDTFLEEHNPESSSSEDGDVNAIEKQGSRCYNCEESENLRQLGDLKLCNACFTHFRNYHRHRLCLKPVNFDGSSSETMKCPKGVAEVIERFVDFATEEDDAAHSSSSKKSVDEESDDDLQIVSVIRPPEMRYTRILKRLERQEVLARGNCVRLEHALRMQFEKELNENLERYRISRLPSSSTSGRPRRCPSWSYKEKWQALFAFQRYGKDFNAVAEVLESKTPDMVKAFYYEMREEIDDMISKTNDYYRKLADTYEFGQKTEVNTSKDVIDIE
uniref:ELM2 domain-containing protein n=1 Tax=Elaeophora elaphi TaxID=1147741 RepID=A0A0R3RVU2_9BILA